MRFRVIDGERRCTSSPILPRSSCVHVHWKATRVVAAIACAATVTVAAAHAQQAPAQRSYAELLRAGSGIAVTAAVAQAVRAPEAWPRTATGAGLRLADQSGFVAVRSLAHLGISRALPWNASTAPCPSGNGARTRCAITQTFVVHTADGAARPDVARIGSLAIASFGALLWRPERATRGEASALVLTRLGSGLVFAALRRGVRGRSSTVPE